LRTYGTPKAFVVISTDLLPLAGQQGSKSLKGLMYEWVDLRNKVPDNKCKLKLIKNFITLKKSGT